jgi:uncharacterized protein (TIGR02646 family)
MGIIVRTKNVPKYNYYRKYKKYLREDFENKCVYCKIHEGENGSFHNFACDHFRPKSIIEFRYLKNSYENLMYSCLDCNRKKGKNWPNEELIKKGYQFIDPCEKDYNDYFDIDPSTFHIIPKANITEKMRNAVEYMKEKIKLNRNQLIILRKMHFLEENIEKNFEEVDFAIEEGKVEIIKGRFNKAKKNYFILKEKRFKPLRDEDME